MDSTESPKGTAPCYDADSEGKPTPPRQKHKRRSPWATPSFFDFSTLQFYYIIMLCSNLHTILCKSKFIFPSPAPT